MAQKSSMSAALHLDPDAPVEYVPNGDAVGWINIGYYPARVSLWVAWGPKKAQLDKIDNILWAFMEMRQHLVETMGDNPADPA